MESQVWDTQAATFGEGFESIHDQQTVTRRVL